MRMMHVVGRWLVVGFTNVQHQCSMFKSWAAKLRWSIQRLW